MHAVRNIAPYLPTNVELIPESVLVRRGRGIGVGHPAQLEGQLRRSSSPSCSLLRTPALVADRHRWHRAYHLGCNKTDL
jgi:hypothetical protein